MPDRSSRTVTLTDRQPVEIAVAEWPVIAMVRYPAAPKDDADEFTLRVRRHEDGRTLVYGVTIATRIDARWRGGALLDTPTHTVSAIRRVARDGGMPETVCRSCVADLPAVPVDEAVRHESDLRNLLDRDALNRAREVLERRNLTSVGVSDGDGLRDVDLAGALSAAEQAIEDERL